MRCLFLKGKREALIHCGFRALIALSAQLLVLASGPLWAAEAPSLGDAAEISVELIDPVLHRQSISSSKGGIVRGPGVHFEAHQILVQRNQNSKYGGKLTASGGVYVHYFGKRFVGDEVEYDFFTRTGVLRQGRTQLGQWIVGSCEVHLLADGSCQLRLPYATISLRTPSRWLVKAHELIYTGEKDIDLRKLEVMVGPTKIAKLGSFKVSTYTLQHWPLLLTGQWGSLSQRRLGLRFKMSSRSWRANFDLDRWWTQGWGFGGHVKGRGEEKNWSLAHYALRETMPTTHWRFCSSATYHRKWIENDARFEAKIFHASDADFATHRLANSAIYKPTPISFLSYHRAQDSFVLNTQAICKINRFETVKQLLPMIDLRARPFHLPKNLIFDQGINVAHLKLSFAKKDAQRDFATWRGLWTPSIYRGVDLGHQITATTMVSARAYGVSTTPSGGSVAWVTPQWDGHLQGNWIWLAGCYTHRITPYLHHRVARSFADRFAQCYVFDLEEAPTAVQKLEWGARGTVSSIERALFEYEVFLRDPIGPLSKASAHSAQAHLIWHATTRCDLGLKAIADRRRKSIDRMQLSVKATLNASLAAIIEYDQRSSHSWRGIYADRNWLQHLHSQEELLASALSDKRQILNVRLYWRLEPDWVFSAHSRWGFGRNKNSALGQTAPYWEVGCRVATALTDTWRFMLQLGQRKGVINFSYDISASAKTPVIGKRNRR